MLFGVSTDYLLDMPSAKALPVDGLSDREIAALLSMIDCLKRRGNGNLPL